MDPLTGQPITTFKPNSIITYGSQTNGPYLPRGSRPTAFGTQAQLPSSQNPNSTNSSSQNHFSGPESVAAYKKLTDAELQSKIEKELCFRCDAKFPPGHRCKNKELQVLVLQEGHIDSEAGPHTSIDETQEEEVEEVAKLSLNSVVGLSTPRTMKVKGKIAQHEVVVLIDYGATHNFISTKLVQELELPLECTSGYGILMGTGAAVKGKGVCRGVILTLQNIEIVVDFLPLELGSADVILGMQWLESLGGMQVN